MVKSRGEKKPWKVFLPASGQALCSLTAVAFPTRTPAASLTSPLSWRVGSNVTVAGERPLNVYELEAWSGCGNSERRGNLYEVPPGINARMKE